MQIQLESTDKIVEVNGVPARVWEGHTDTGIPVHALITRIGVDKDADLTQFEAELQECRAPSAAVDEFYPAKVVL